MDTVPAAPDAGAYDAAYYAARYRYHPTSMYWWSVRYYARLVLRHLPATTSGRPRVLEIGCGVGHVLARLSGRCAVVGLDLSPEALRQARAVVPRARLLEGSADRLPFADACFDAVLARHVLEHLPRPAAAIAELRRVLRPGGTLVAAMPNPSSIMRPVKGAAWVGFRDPTHVSLLLPTEWQRLFAAAGFRVLDEHGDGLWDVPYLPLVPTPLQLALFALPAAAQVLAAGSFIPTRAGESVIFALRAGPGGA
ncbi:MAG TPA: class I SAM-dependent methyltransferase [Chloroflexota bacterium]|nr:class I SAM-dependent methyltransferase [Chloroflexota bacterium]